MPDSTQPPVKRGVSTQHANPAENANPPPAYNSSEARDHGRQQQSQHSNHDEIATPPSQTYPPPSPRQSLPSPQQLFQQRPRTSVLHVYRDSLLNRNLTIQDHDQTAVAYTVAANHGSIISEKPHMRFYRGPVVSQLSTQPVGTATFHHIRQTIDIELHNRAFSMRSSNIMGYSYQFQSAMGLLIWKSGVFGYDLTLITSGKKWLAKFDANILSRYKRGILQFDHGNISAEGIDEIVITGIAMMEQMRRRQYEGSI